MTKNNKVSQRLVEKTIQELTRPKKPKARSRIWQDPEGYRYLTPWSNTVLLRFLVRRFTENLPKSEYRRKAQIDDAARSVVRNIEEGYKRPTTKEYLNFLGFSQGSLEEVKGDIKELADDGFLKSQPGSTLADLNIDLGKFHQKLKEGKGDYRRVEEIKGKISMAIDKNKIQRNPSFKFLYHPLTLLYSPLKNLKSKDLTVEIFLELVNKTDWLLRKLVQSLEKKLVDDQKVYQIEKARIKGNLQLR